MSYAEQYALINSDLFRGRIMMSSMAAANNIANEDPNTESHDDRLALAEHVLKDPSSSVWTFIYAVASNPQIAGAGESASLDGDLDYVIASNWTIKAVEWNTKKGSK